MHEIQDLNLEPLSPEPYPSTMDVTLLSFTQTRARVQSTATLGALHATRD